MRTSMTPVQTCDAPRGLESQGLCAKNARLIAAARGETDSGERFSFAAGSPSAPWLAGVVGCPAPILGARVSGRLLDRAECGDAFERIA
jgi:hypothetical protein